MIPCWLRFFSIFKMEMETESSDYNTDFDSYSETSEQSIEESLDYCDELYYPHLFNYLMDSFENDSYINYAGISI